MGRREEAGLMAPYSIRHEEVQPSSVRVLHDEIPEGGDVFRPGDVAVSIDPSLPCIKHKGVLVGFRGDGSGTLTQGGPARRGASP